MKIDKTCPWCGEEMAMMDYPRERILVDTIIWNSDRVFVPYCEGDCENKVQVTIEAKTEEEAWVEFSRGRRS